MIPILISAMFVIVTATSSYACNGRNEAEVNNGEFHIGYSSWVDSPDLNEDFFIYARCIRSMNEKWVKANWKFAGLKGIAHPKIPLYAEYAFLTDRTVLANGTLKFGRKEPFKFNTSANFLQNEAENDIGFAETAFHAEGLEARLLEEGLPEGLATISSSASVNFQIEERLFSLQFELVSSLDGLSIGEGEPIQATVSLFQIEGVTGESLSIELAPRSKLLSSGLARVTDLTSINLTLEGEPSLQSFLISVPEFAEGLNMYQDTIDVVYNENILASFPVSFYADTRMNARL